MTRISRAQTSAAAQTPGALRRGRRTEYPSLPVPASSIALIAVRWELFRLGGAEEQMTGGRGQGPWELSLVVAVDRSRAENGWRGTVQISPTGDRRVVALEQFAVGATADSTVGDIGGREARTGAMPVLCVDRAAGLVHVDAPGFLSATFEIDRGGTARVLFASSPVLAAMKIAGGTYEVLGGTLTRVV